MVECRYGPILAFVSWDSEDVVAKVPSHIILLHRMNRRSFIEGVFWREIPWQNCLSHTLYVVFSLRLEPDAGQSLHSHRTLLWQGNLGKDDHGRECTVDVGDNGSDE